MALTHRELAKLVPCDELLLRKSSQFSFVRHASKASHFIDDTEDPE